MGVNFIVVGMRADESYPTYLKFEVKLHDKSVMIAFNIVDNSVFF